MNGKLIWTACFGFTTVVSSLASTAVFGQGGGVQVVIRQAEKAEGAKTSAEGPSRVAQLRALAEKVEGYAILPTQNVKDQVIYEVGQMPAEEGDAYLKELATLSLDSQKVKIHVLIQSAFNKINQLPTPNDRIAGSKAYRAQIQEFVSSEGGEAGPTEATEEKSSEGKKRVLALSSGGATVKGDGKTMVLRQVKKADAGSQPAKIVRGVYMMEPEAAEDLAVFLATHVEGVAASADGHTLTIHATSEQLAAFRSFYGLIRSAGKQTSAEPAKPRKGIAVLGAAGSAVPAEKKEK